MENFDEAEKIDKLKNKMLKFITSSMLFFILLKNKQ